MVNFVMNLYLYFLGAKTLKRTATRLRIFVGSAAGAALSILLLLLPGVPVWFRRFAGPMAVSMATTAVIYRLKNVEAVFRTTGYLLVYAFVFGGIMKFLLAELPSLKGKQNSVWYILGMGMIGYQAVAWWLEQAAGKKAAEICRVRLSGYDREVELDALVDTGNSLREPVSGKPVSVVDEEVLERFPELKLPEKLKVIPYHSVGKANGMLEGYEVPLLSVRVEGECIQWQKVIVGISKNRISAGGRYQMILHPDLCSEASRMKGTAFDVQKTRRECR
ncbi:MAG: sigma-E processing peptidase SpoIIGA [Lachnospiraceae bacterium]|nr:sigma-E processing peptidase SpoIIGA [Lachnospiraceae bacterium]